MTRPLEVAGRLDGDGSPSHEIERAVARLNRWFAEHRQRIPPCFNWRSFRRERHVPVFKAIRTTAIKDWKVEELNHLFRVVRRERGKADLEMPIEVLVADRSLQGEFLDVPALMDAALGAIAARCLLGRFSPRLWWFWLHYPSLVSEIGTYVHGIRLRVDAETPVSHDQYRVFEEFNVPLVEGQQTAIGNSCMFVLEQAHPHGAVPYWRFSVTQHGKVVVGPHVLQAKPIYLGEQLLAVIKKIGDESVTLSVLTSEGGLSPE